jgi:2-phosphosulfolactate phosphatase
MRIEHRAEEASKRGDVLVVVDALRTSVTMAVALHLNASEIVTLETPEECLQYVGSLGYVTAGEKDGRKVPGYNFGNSPTGLLEYGSLRKKKLAICTTNGTRVLKAIKHDVPTLIGSMVNCTAVREEAIQIAEKSNLGISIIAVGWKGKPTYEDTLTAEVIASPEEYGKNFFDDFRDSFSGGKLEALGYLDDIKFCSQKDILPVVPVYKRGVITRRS